MITEGSYKGDFICSYDDWLSVSSDYILTGTGVKDPDFSAYVIGKSPNEYAFISNALFANYLTETPYGFTAK